MKKAADLRRFSRFLPACLFVFIVFFAFPQERPGRNIPTVALESFETFLKRQMAYDRIPGLSIGFLKGDYVWAKGFGLADLENEVPADPESSYRLASVTKTMTAVAVLLLVEAGKVDLDADVRKYVPYFPRQKWPVTIRQLLGHLGGISHYRNYAVEGRIREPMNTRQSIDIFKDFGLVAEPGVRYLYSSYGFNLLGAVIEEASGQPYEVFIKENIFLPLGMAHSRLDSPLDLIPNRVRGYRLVQGLIKNSDYVDISSRFAAGGTRSTVIDLLKYARGIMQGKLLEEESRRRMFTSMVQRGGTYTGYGMGWFVSPWRGHFQVFHGGSQPETRTFLLLFPGENFAVAVAANLEDCRLEPYFVRLAELILDEDLDGMAYATDRNKQILYTACDLAFSYGLSSYEWNGQSLASSEKDLGSSFAFFNRCVDDTASARNYQETREKILSGVHPAAGEALIKVGSHMAEVLGTAHSQEALRSYHRSGALRFFADYIRARERSSPAGGPDRFSPDFCRLIGEWERDWHASYTESVQRLFLTPDTDFDQTGKQLKEAFEGASLYPDFSQALAGAAWLLLKNKEKEKAFRAFNLGLDLYPSSPVPFANLACAHVWSNDPRSALDLFRKARALDEFHPVTEISRFIQWSEEMVQEGKLKENLDLMLIAIELFPRNAFLLEEVGDAYFRLRQKSGAVEYYKRALLVESKRESARRKLRAAERMD